MLDRGAPVVSARTGFGLAAAAGFVASIVLANYLTTRYGFIPVGFGLTAAAGTIAAGLALGLRDLVQDALGRVAVLAVIAVGAAMSFLVADPFIAIASALAVLVSEVADFAVYTPLRGRVRVGQRRWVVAVLASNAVGAVVDTAVFLAVAFGWAAVAPGMAGQLVGKGWATLAVIVVGVGVARAHLSRQPMHPVGA